ncbi:MAG TPA: DAK2 domain-containing protein [Solirubrobacteraceae bacterium]|nr:DAK2 domain-containing protein [Solirubrobacteraceae bacterium]
MDPSLVRFRAVVEGALSALEARRQEINDLNVFPVADGDTGDNMALTLRAVLDELARLDHQGDIDDIGRDHIVEAVARAALLGARGNSGVILSQLVRGAAEELISRPGELVDPVLVTAALARAADRAYNSVREPAEGTILTVAREMAARMASELAHMPDEQRRLDPLGDPDLQNRLIADILDAALDTGEASLRRGPELLPVLRQAGVVDAGAYGLLVVLAGVVGVLRGDAPPPLEHHAPARVTHPQHESSTHRYCTNFAVTGDDLDASYFIPLLEQIGDSVLVVGDRATLKVHVHTDDPERATAIFAEHGGVSRLDVADMREQVLERAERLAQAEQDGCGVLAVVSGDGMADLFRSLGATPLDGGPTLNPSTYELLAGIHTVPAEEVVVLPNSPNVRMAAERAAELSDKVVRVVASRSQQAGLAAAVALDGSRGAEENARAMQEALDNVRTGAVTEAARDDGDQRFRAGEAIGFVEEQIIAWGSPEETLRQVLDRLAQDAELVTLIEGPGAPLRGAEIEALIPDGVEFELSHGGQPSYWWLLAAE